MIHLQDIGKIVTLFLKNKELKGRYLLSDGLPLKWSQLAAKYSLPLPGFEPGPESRSFNTRKLKSTLPENYCFRQALEE